ncbi:MAG: DNA repair protein RecN [Candidatus Hydrogenedentota bacterium]|nr:MAG: DNA repair protein RecN [Candidatus Hydrogenedentota bacterium]
MLDTLRIQNYALIDDMEIQFGPGFNVLTGETGAGKSIIVGALNLILGARASSDAVRHGAKQAKIDAIFSLTAFSPSLKSLLEEQGVEWDDSELHITRIVSAEGRSRAYIQGTLVPIGILSQLGDDLVDMHGQHDHQSLLKPERQRDLLDALAGAEGLRDSVATHVTALHALEREIETLNNADRESARRVEFLKFELGEIDQAHLEPGEDEELQSRRNVINNAEKIFSLVSQACQTLADTEETPTTLDTLSSAARDIEELASTDASFQVLSERFGNVQSELQSLTDEIRSIAESPEFDPQELDSVNSRLNLIRELKRKYGDDIARILAYRAEIKDEIDSFQNKDKRLEELNLQQESRREKAQKQAEKLSKQRKKCASSLNQQITHVLQELGMEGAEFSVHITEKDLGLHGIDHVEFLLAANPGEPPKAMRNVASGGELSRVMLALKAVFAEADRIPTLIFDEIDAGIGGSVANQVALKLKSLASTHQTLCITHLPQIAAAATSHYHVAKTSEKGKTITRIQRIDEKTRIEELARLLDGTLTDVSRLHAESLLNEMAS